MDSQRPTPSSGADLYNFTSGVAILGNGTSDIKFAYAPTLNNGLITFVVTNLDASGSQGTT